MKSTFRVIPSLLVILLAMVFTADFAAAQRGSARKKQVKKPAKKELAVVSGVIKVDRRKDFQVKYDEINTKLRQEVQVEKLPTPSQWNTMKEVDRKQWLTKFYQSDRGKRFLQTQEKKLKNAAVFDVRYNDKGKFEVYDVPPGTYGLQGRVDKEIEGILYGFEVFAKIVVSKDVDQVKLAPIPIEITPLFKPNQAAPPIRVKTNDGKELTYDLAAYKDHYIFLNFLNTKDVGPGYQEQVQQMYKDLGKSHKVKLVSIVLDDKDKDDEEGKGRADAIKWLLSKKLKHGSYCFTDGWEHSVTQAYGIRSTPSGWLISPDKDRKILMSQHEFFQQARVKASITNIIRDRIDGKDQPTLAKPPEKADADEKAEDK